MGTSSIIHYRGSMLWWFYFCLFTSSIVCVDSFMCEDELFKDCQKRRERGECEGQDHSHANLMLADCRKSCRKQYSGMPLPKIIQTYGGLEDHVVDVFGFKLPICPENGGFTREGRINIQMAIAVATEQPVWLPKFTEVGFQKISIPPDVYSMLLKEYQRNMPFMYEEYCVNALMNCKQIIDNKERARSSLRSRDTFMIDLSQDVINKVQEKLLPLAEEFANTELKYEHTYGIRRYKNGTWMASHVDVFKYVISAILNIGQRVEEDWPLYILDNDGRQHQVILKPGELFWYESARLIHGRPQPFIGEFFDNLFIHYSPAGVWYNTTFEVGKQLRRTPLTIQEIRSKQELK